jgi:hypothetical protein
VPSSKPAPSTNRTHLVTSSSEDDTPPAGACASGRRVDGRPVGPGEVVGIAGAARGHADRSEEVPLHQVLEHGSRGFGGRITCRCDAKLL